jgi:hypothetical protein
MSENDGKILGELGGGKPVPPTVNDTRDPIGMSAGDVRPKFRVQLPADCLGDEWSGSQEETFVICQQLRPNEQVNAKKIGGDDNQAIGTEMILQMIVQVGSWTARGQRDRLIKWWENIGPVARDLFGKLWLTKHQSTEGQLATFLGTVSPV